MKIHSDLLKHTFSSVTILLVFLMIHFELVLDDGKGFIQMYKLGKLPCTIKYPIMADIDKLKMNILRKSLISFPLVSKASWKILNTMGHCKLSFITFKDDLI